jgi:hypothetical protein
MRSTAVCMIVNNNYFQARYCIENLLNKSKSSIRLYFLAVDMQDERLNKYINEITPQYCIRRVPKDCNLANEFNKVLQNIIEDNCCIFPSNIYVNKDWLANIELSSDTCIDAGIISIKNGTEETTSMPLLHRTENTDDVLKNVHVTKTNDVEGIMYTKTENLKKIGYLNHELPYSCSYIDLCFRFTSKGLKNYYLSEETCFQLESEDALLFPKKTKEDLQILIDHVNTELKKIKKTNEYEED